MRRGKISEINVSGSKIKIAAPDEPEPIQKKKITIITEESFFSKISKLKNKDGKNILTNDQIEKLKNIKLSNGEDFFLSNNDTKEFLYEIISQFYMRDFDDVYQALIKKKWNNRSEYFFQSSPEMELSRQKNVIDKEIYNYQVEAVKGAFKCAKCGSQETVSAEKQYRRADEPSTINVTCLGCGNRWIS